MKFSVFKQIKNKQFDYTPRYYDERKERLRNLEKKYRDVSDDEYTQGYRMTNYRDNWKTKRQEKSSINTKIRLFVILIFLFFITYVAIKRYDLLSLIYG